MARGAPPVEVHTRLQVLPLRRPPPGLQRALERSARADVPRARGCRGCQEEGGHKKGQKMASFSTKKKCGQVSVNSTGHDELVLVAQRGVLAIFKKKC
eukprot:scaffold41772_cov33-Phaeocystis_antarctica.AAC.3